MSINALLILEIMFLLEAIEIQLLQIKALSPNNTTCSSFSFLHNSFANPPYTFHPAIERIPPECHLLRLLHKILEPCCLRFNFQLKIKIFQEICCDSDFSHTATFW
jgi:hypothetical protein